MPKSRLWLPALLGLIAAAGHYTVLDEAKATTDLAALQAEVSPGTKLEANHFYPVPVRGGPELYRGTVPFDQVHAVVGKTVRRRLDVGELLFRADVELDDYQFERPHPDRTRLTIPLRKKAFYPAPAPGEYVEVFVRNTDTTTSNALPLKKFGPFRYLGWVATPGPREESDAAMLGLEVFNSPTPRDAELRAVQESGNPDRVVRVEVVRGPK